MKIIKGLLVNCLFLLFFLSGASASAADFQHKQWDQLLKKYVVNIQQGRATQVDYAGMKTDRVELKQYLAALSKVSDVTFQGWSESQRLAFLINGYNAWTVELILTEYPNLESIKDLGSLFSSPWKKDFIPLLGKTRSLDNIEQDLIRGNFKEPRIHFALNCASIGCPALRGEAYQSDLLEAQLSDAINLFLSDSSRNRLQGNELQISKIFKWYQDDFEQQQTLAQFLVKNGKALKLTEQQQQALLRGDIDIEYLDYNWSLNVIR
ncbi:MAG: hypothetical protein ACJAT7_002821 [Psychromonas sp.]|jgi:hypothetical protein|uniref:DUF547 domain-containing protein n=1 Tax=Psychromonas sp. TaxID=1884585 RepID=UPI0039E32DFC